MPKKNDELKAKAKELYKQGFSLVDIAQELNIKRGTVRSWKSREKWQSAATPVATGAITKTGNNDSVATEKKYTRGKSPNSLANLKAHKHPNIQSGEKLAEKHGLYSDNSNDPDYRMFYDQAMESIGYTSQDAYAEAYANYKVAMRDIEKGRLDYVEPVARAAMMVNSAGEKAVKNRMGELEMLEREQRASGTSPVIESIREMTEGFMQYANEAHSETN